MKAREFIDQRIRSSLSRSTAIAANIVILFFLSMGLWHIFNLETESWIYRFGFAAIVISTGLEAVHYSRRSKAPIVCPHCDKPLLLGRGWSRLPAEYKFCHACGASMESETTEHGITSRCTE